MQVTRGCGRCGWVCEPGCWGRVSCDAPARAGLTAGFTSQHPQGSTCQHFPPSNSIFLLCPTQEVTDKSERITQLEQEKSALIKQLFEARAHNNHETSQLDSTFI